MHWIAFLELICVGLLAGTWGTLIGAGGGFLIVPLLLFRYSSMTAAEVTAISLVAVFANGISGTGAYARLGRIDYRSGILFLIAMFPSGAIGAILVNYIARGGFQLIFGMLILPLAIYVFTNPSSSLKSGAARKGADRRIVDSNGTVYQYTLNLKLGTCVALVVGLMAGVLGIGGGIFNVSALVFLIGMPIQVATATSQFMTVGVSLAANATNFLQGDLWGMWGKAMALAIGTIVGAQLGARISQRLGFMWITRVLATTLLVMGLRLVYNGITLI